MLIFVSYFVSVYICYLYIVSTTLSFMILTKTSG